MGLQALDLLQVMRRYPHHFLTVLIKDERKLTAAILEDHLQPNFSNEGTTKRQTEEKIFMNMSLFPQDMEGMNCSRLSNRLCVCWQSLG